MDHALKGTPERIDQAKYGFADASYADRDSAAEVVAAAAKELAKMAKTFPGSGVR